MAANVRTFGQLFADRKFRHFARCSFCKQLRHDTLGYSTRHNVCEDCGKERADEVLPSVKRHEKLQADLAAIRAKAGAQ